MNLQANVLESCCPAHLGAVNAGCSRAQLPHRVLLLQPPYPGECSHSGSIRADTTWAFPLRFPIYSVWRENRRSVDAIGAVPFVRPLCYLEWEHSVEFKEEIIVRATTQTQVFLLMTKKSICSLNSKRPFRNYMHLGKVWLEQESLEKTDLATTASCVRSQHSDTNIYIKCKGWVYLGFP